MPGQARKGASAGALGSDRGSTSKSVTTRESLKYNGSASESERKVKLQLQLKWQDGQSDSDNGVKTAPMTVTMTPR